MSATWTNEPSGATTLLDHSFSTTTTTRLQDLYSSGVIVSDGAEPVSPPTAMRYRIEAYAKEGGGQMVYTAPALYRDLFVGFSWRTNPEFQGRIVQNKLFFIRGPVLGNSYWGMWNPPGSPTMKMEWGHNTSGLDNSHTCILDSGLWCTANVGPSMITLGQWHKIEAYVRASTTATSRDGIVIWWVNGVMGGRYLNINYAPAGLNEWQWNNTWDGTQDMGVSNTVAWEHYLGHLYISTGGTVVTSGTPTPTEPDPLPQPQVVLQGLTPASASTTVGGTRQFTISMSGAMPSGATLFTNSSNPSVATVPASVSIAAGASTSTITATGVAIGSTTISTNYNGVTKGSTLQVAAMPTTGGPTTTYTYASEFSGTQGPNWYYMEADGTEMTYIGASSWWQGSDTSGGGVQLIWNNGFHPGASRPSMLRFVVPAAGSARITGAYYDVDTGGGVGCVARVNHNGVTLFTRTISNGDSTGGGYDLTQDVGVGDTLDFVVSNRTADYTFNATNLDPVIVITPATTAPDPTTPPEPITSIVDLFVGSIPIVAGVPFTATVRLSQTVTVDTAVEIRVGSTSILTAPTSVTVLAGTSSISFSVTPLRQGLVAMDAILNGTKRVTLNVQSPATPVPDVPPPEGPIPLPPPNATDPVIVTTVVPYQDGAKVTISEGADALAFRFNGHDEYITIPNYPLNATQFVHVFTWPSGTTQVCYRARASDRGWGPASCAGLVALPPPPPPPSVTKSVIDKDGIRWQLTGKKSPYILKRNGSTMDHTYGVLLRKSGDGYVEVLQTNGIWIRRKNDAWEVVS